MLVSLMQRLLPKSFLLAFSALATTLALLGRPSLVLPTASTGQADSTPYPTRTAYTSVLPTSAHRVATIVATASLFVALPARAKEGTRKEYLYLRVGVIIA